MNLSEAFSAVAIKELVRVDLPDRGSNQHEINGASSLRDFFGTSSKQKGEIDWFYFADDQEPVREFSKYTFYDARERIPGRTEWRMYYSGAFLSHAEIGDIIVLLKSYGSRIRGLVFQRTSIWLSAVMSMLDTLTLGPDFQVLTREDLGRRDISFTQTLILEELGIRLPVETAGSDRELVMRELGGVFPDTKNMSKFARENSQFDVSDPDNTLMVWIEREEKLFLAVEEDLVSTRIKAGFAGVDDFIQYSLSVQNRRKSRMGYALQNHLQALFEENEIQFTAQAHTEGRSKPDFIFPGEIQYQNPLFDGDLLTMLAAKSTLKERWRQIPSEAERISRKHVLTLDPGMTPTQFSEMQSYELIVVLPQEIRGLYEDPIAAETMPLAAFIELVSERQAVQ